MEISKKQTISVSIPKDATNVLFEIAKSGESVNIIFTTQEYIEKYFPIVRASTLSLKDKFLKHEPASEKQKVFKQRLIRAIECGLHDFRAQRMDPTFDEKGEICYQKGKKPAVGKEVYEWILIASNFMREKNSRLGTTNERIAFLGLLIKYLIEEQGYTASNAWKAVCDQSKDLGHYCDSENAKHGFEPTGSRQVGEWYDLANTGKITDDGWGKFEYFGNDYGSFGWMCPLARIDTISNLFYKSDYEVGWIVLDV